MATTPQAIITNALTLLPGVIWPGAAPSSIMSADGLLKLNDMLATWSNERLMIYGLTTTAYQLTANVGAYTIGNGGTFNSARPIAIVSAAIITPSMNLRYKLKILTAEAFQSIRDRSATATLPTELYNNELYPLSTLFLHPLPNSSATQLELYAWQQFTQFNTLADTFDLPPGYERAVTYNLAVELAPVYRSQITPETMKTAQDSKDALKAVNAPPTHITGMGAEQIAQAQIQGGSIPVPPQ